MAEHESENDKPRRRFLKRSAALVSGVAMGACAPPPGGTGDAGEGAAATAFAMAGDEGVLDALARVVLPGRALGDEGVARVAAGFRAWLEGFEPGAELDHPYLYTDEILYGPAHPGPVWNAQLEALEIEAQRRHGGSFRELDLETRAALVEDQLPEELDGSLPYAGSAPHVALALLGYFYDTTEALDLGYQAAVQKQTCRGLESAPDAPAERGSQR